MRNKKQQSKFLLQGACCIMSLGTAWEPKPQFSASWNVKGILGIPLLRYLTIAIPLALQLAILQLNTIGRFTRV